MANSNVIPDLKTNIIRAIINDEDLFAAINPPDVDSEDPDDLVNKYIFNYNKNPNVITKVCTFLTVMVHTKVRRNTSFVTPTIEIWIYSHNNHMDMNIRGIRDNRCDFIGKLLDEKFNGSSGYGGFGRLLLTNNTEGTYNQDFMYRRLIFETIDLNDSLCEVVI